MKILDNINHTVREDLQDTMQKGSRVSIAAACFSIYAYQELKKQLEEIAELRFIFTSPTFVQENTPKERREFYIPKLTREKSLYGTEFEVRLRNELTQKALAKECADWVRRKVKFRSNVSGEQMPGFMTVGESSYMPISRFTTVDLGCERGNNAYYPVQRTEAFENGRYFLSLFDEIWNDSSRLQDVTDIVLQSISTAYRENSPDFIYFFTLYNIFSEFLEDVSEDNLPNEATGFKQSKIWNMLYDFQRDAALAIIHKLEQYNGCILADSVGLGKTFTALAVIKYYENRNKSVLVLCPKKLAANWNIYKGNYVNNPLVEDRFRYDVLYHTDLSRSGGTSNGIDLAALNWGNFDLVVIDESHNFRNGSNTSTDEKENRYTKLMNRVIRSGVRTKVLMLSATPVNNRFVDLKNQLALAYEGDAGKINEKLNTSSPIDEIFRQAQKAFNTWSKLPVTERTTNLQSAKTLSKTNDYITSKFNPTILTNESAAYFNKSLYPYFNEFERKLRKLLYLKSALQHDATASQNIKELESKDLGTIFELLFTDAQFIKDVKKNINEKSWQFTRDELINTINNLSENTVWDSLIGHETISVLRSDFIRVKNYRNDVMHAHNMDAASYTSALGVIKKINDQLDDELNKLVKSPEKEEANDTQTFNSTLNQALRDHETATAISVNVPNSSYEKFFHDIVLQPEIPPAVRNLQVLLAQEAVSSKYSELAKTFEEVSQKMTAYIKLAQTLSSPEIKEPYQNILRILEAQHDELSKPQDDLEKNIGETPPIEESENPNEQAENADPQPDSPEH